MAMTYLVGWKELARVGGVHVRTLKKWHYLKKPIPYRKSTDGEKGRVMIEWEEFKLWIQSVTSPATITPSI